MTGKNSLGHPQYAIMVNMSGQLSIVIGGGVVALRKVRQLLECGAVVTVISPNLTSELAGLAKRSEIHYVQRGYEVSDIIGARLVFAATDDPSVNERVAADCNRLHIWVNVAHASERSDFTNPGVLRYGPVQINVSTGGASPTLTRHIVDKVDQIIDHRIGLLANKLYQARIEAQEHIHDSELRMLWLRRFSDACWAAWEQEEAFPDWQCWIQNQPFQLVLDNEEADPRRYQDENDSSWN